MSVKRLCANKRCGHDEDSHYLEKTSQLDPNNYERILPKKVRRACLSLFCDCRQFEEPEK